LARFTSELARLGLFASWLLVSLLALGLAAWSELDAALVSLLLLVPLDWSELGLLLVCDEDDLLPFVPLLELCALSATGRHTRHAVVTAIRNTSKTFMANLLLKRCC